MPIITLSAQSCAAAECRTGKKKTDYYDKDLKGFVLEVRATGGKTYYLRYVETNGRQRQIRIGPWEDVTFAAAKKRAQQLRAAVVMGEDPLAEKQKKRSTINYAELARQHIDHAKSYQKRPENSQSVIENHLIPKWGAMRLDEIKQAEVAAWLGEKRKSLAPATVEKLRVTFSRSFELARRWGLPGAEINPVRGIPRFKFDNARNRFLTAEEVERLLHYADRSANPRLGSIIRLLLYTGARKSELLQARWSNIDLDRRLWFIPDSKTGKARHVPLSGEAVKVFAALPRLSEYALANPRTLRPYTCIKRPWETVRSKARLGDLHIHDLRHSAASFMVNAGVDLFAVGRILGHADHQSTMRYSHLANDTLLAAVEAGAAKMKQGDSQ